jgi:ribokinase
MQKPSIVVVGSINMDFVLQASRCPGSGESLLGERYWHNPGGKGANQAVAAARLGAGVTFVGRVGDDPNGRDLCANLHREAIAVDDLRSDAQSPTGLAVIILESTGQNRILVYPGANMKLAPDDVLHALRRGSFDAVLLQLEIPAQTVLATCRASKRLGIPVVLDAGPAQAFPLEELEGVEILSPNETETLALIGMGASTPAEAERAAPVLAQKSGARYVAIKMGEQGAFLWGDGRGRHYPGHRIRAVDATAAGDAFTAALTISYLVTGDIHAAVAYANVVGALTATRLGAQTSLPTAEEVSDFRSSLEATGAANQ